MSYERNLTLSQQRQKKRNVIRAIAKLSPSRMVTKHCWKLEKCFFFVSEPKKFLTFPFFAKQHFVLSAVHSKRHCRTKNRIFVFSDALNFDKFIWYILYVCWCAVRIFNWYLWFKGAAQSIRLAWLTFLQFDSILVWLPMCGRHPIIYCIRIENKKWYSSLHIECGHG